MDKKKEQIKAYKKTIRNLTEQIISAKNIN